MPSDNKTTRAWDEISDTTKESFGTFMQELGKSVAQNQTLAEARALFEAAKRANDRESADRLSKRALALAIEAERQNAQS